MSDENNTEGKQTNNKAVDIGQWIVYGFIAGMLVGVVTDNLTLWIGIGMSLGILFGAIKSMQRG